MVVGFTKQEVHNLEIYCAQYKTRRAHLIVPVEFYAARKSLVLFFQRPHAGHIILEKKKKWLVVVVVFNTLKSVVIYFMLAGVISNSRNGTCVFFSKKHAAYLTERPNQLFSS